MAEKILTLRQYEVLHLVSYGLTNAQISAHLEVAESTVKDHLDAVFAKLGVHDRASAVRVGYLMKILS